MIVSMLTLIFVTISVNAQITEGEDQLTAVKTDTVASWSKGGISSLNLAQTSLVNWAAGGQNSVAVNGMLGLYANYLSPKSSWENSLDIGYGLLQQSGFDGLMKTDDRFDFTSKYGRKTFKDFYYAGLVNFRTQFAEGYNYPDTENKISDFFAPAYLLTAAGLNYIPNKYFNAFISPITGKFTFVYDEHLSSIGAFGVEKGQRSRQELGGYVRLGFIKDDFNDGFFKNISIGSKLDLFSNYLDNPQYIDVNWENLIGMKVNDYISISLNTNLIYDYDIKSIQMVNGEAVEAKAKVQFKEILGVGFMYKF